MKTTGNNSDVAHYWANQNQSEFRNANGSFYFIDKIIYSYGSHFPIARYVDNVVLLTTEKNSVTTQKHISLTRQAISHKTVFDVMDIMACNEKQHADNFSDYKERINDLLKKSVRARTNQAWLLSSAESLANEANKYADHFGLTVEKIDVTQFDMESVREAIKKEQIEKRKQEAARKLKLYKDNLQKINLWRRGESVQIPYDIPCMLRVDDGKQRIETSQGASIPLLDAINLWRFVLIAIEKKVVINTANKLGFYTLDEIDKNGNVTAGCHSIKFNELELMAKKLKLI